MAERMDAYWMPFTANRQFKANPRMLVSADGMHYTDADGRQVGEANVFPKALRMEVPTRWKRLPRKRAAPQESRRT